jgi:hypothetical protein
MSETADAPAESERPGTAEALDATSSPEIAANGPEAPADDPDVAANDPDVGADGPEAADSPEVADPPETGDDPEDDDTPDDSLPDETESPEDPDAPEDTPEADAGLSPDPDPDDPLETAGLSDTADPPEVADDDQVADDEVADDDLDDSDTLEVADPLEPAQVPEDAVSEDAAPEEDVPDEDVSVVAHIPAPEDTVPLGRLTPEDLLPIPGDPGYPLAPDLTRHLRRPVSKLAVIALVTGILPAIPIALAAGFAALAGIRRSGRRGRGMAVTALFLATAWIIVGGAVGTVAVLTHGFKKPLQTVYHESAVFSLRPGQCIDIQNGSSPDVVSCTVPHDAEVFGTFTLPGSSWPGTAAVQQEASAGCGTRLDGYLNPQLAISLTQTYVYPSQVDWSAGTRTVICEVRASSGQLSESVRG